MNVEEFLNADLKALSEATGIDVPRWSRYLNGGSISEATLVAAAARLGLSTVELYAAIEQRRAIKRLKEIRKKNLRISS